MMLFLKQFVKELTFQVKMLEFCMIFRSCETDNIKTADDAETADDDFINVSEKLHLKYKDFFNIDKTEQQSSH
jgi:hypothetical protein